MTVPTVYRGTKFHGTSTAEVTVYRRGHGTLRYYLETRYYKWKKTCLQ